MTAPAPGRATGSLTLSIGMVTLPCKLYSGTEDDRIKRSQFHVGTDNAVGKQDYDKETGEILTRDQIEKRFQLDNGEYVALTDEEIQQHLVSENGTCEVVGFLPTTELGLGGRYQVSSIGQLRPAKVNKKSVRAVDEAFALLLDSMKRNQVFALVRFVSRDSTKYAAFTHDGSFLGVYFDSEVRAPLPLPVADLDDKKRELGDRLINSYTLGESPELQNTDADSIREYAEAKYAAIQAGEDVPTATPQKEAEPTNDLLAALEASI